jgi:hypothetical protein
MADAIWRRKPFFLIKISKMIGNSSKKTFLLYFLTKNTTLQWFFSKNSEWRINQNGDSFLTNFLRCSNFVCSSFMSNLFFISDFLLNSKWRPIGNLVFFLIFFKNN